MQKNPHLLPALLLAAFLVLTAFMGKQAPQSPSRPNVLVIVADDWSPHAGAYGDGVVPTPAIDRLTREGVLFENAFCAAPSCSPSRAAMLTGRYPHQLQEGGNLWGTLPTAYPNYRVLLEKNGYKTGLHGKGWGPGDPTVGGYAHNPAGPEFKSLEAFLAELPTGTPFCFWIGSSDPHRPYSPDLKKTAGLNEAALRVPPHLPETPETRTDLLDYYAEVGRFDQTVAGAIGLLEAKGLLENTLIIVTGDNGMPFPRAKANLYDAGTRVPLVVRWGDQLPKGRRYRELVSLVDLAPTILEATKVEAPKEMTGRSLLPLLTKNQSGDRYGRVFLERERHANIRKNNLGYPGRAIRTDQYLYIQNLEPDRWPAGDPDVLVAPGPFGDIDQGLAKDQLVNGRGNPALKQLVHWSLEKRPAEELYDLAKDPHQLQNVANDPAYAAAKKELQSQLLQWRQQTGDPYLAGKGYLFDQYEYYGRKAK